MKNQSQREDIAYEAEEADNDITGCVSRDSDGEYFEDDSGD